MIKIAHVITGLSAGGAEMMLRKLLSGIDRSVYENVVITMRPAGFIGRELEKNGVPVIELTSDKNASVFKIFVQLVRVLGRERPQIVQTWLYHSDLLGTVAAKLLRVPLIVWNVRCAELDAADHPRSLFWIIKVLAYISRIPNAIIVNSKAGMTVHKKLGYKAKKWVLIPNGFEMENFSPSDGHYKEMRRKIGLSEKAVIIGLVARYHPMKDHKTFLEAAGILRNSCPDVHYFLIGSGVEPENEELMLEINRLRLRDHIHLLGEVENVTDVVRSLDIAVSSSYSEGFSNVVGEAMACGVPCAVTDVGDSGTIVGNTGAVVPPRNPRAMADAWSRILKMTRNERKALGASARSRIVDQYSLKHVIECYEDLYREIGPTQEIQKNVLCK